MFGTNTQSSAIQAAKPVETKPSALQAAKPVEAVKPVEAAKPVEAVKKVVKEKKAEVVILTSEEIEAQAAFDEAKAKLDKIKSAKTEEAIETIKNLLRTYHIDPKRFILAGGKKTVEKDEKVVLVAKYRNKDGDEWSGRGAAPKWVKAIRAISKSELENYLIKPA